MGVFRPDAIGGRVSVTDSDALANELSVDGLGIAARIWNIDVGAFFDLTVSNASLVPDEVVAVKDISGLRWIVNAAAGVESVTGASVNNTDPLNPVIKAPNGWTRVDVSPAATNVDITFDGEANEMIEIFGCIKGAAGSGNLLLQPNAVSTNQTFQEDGGATSTPASDAGSGMPVCASANSGRGSFFHCWMYTKTGTQRFVHGSYDYQNASGIVAHYDVSSVWNETATAITSLRLHHTVTNGIVDGSFILYRAIPAGA